MPPQEDKKNFLQDLFRRNPPPEGIKSKDVSPEDWRQNLKLCFAGGFAAFFSFAIVSVMAWQMWSIGEINKQLQIANISAEQEKRFDKSFTNVDTTAKTLYALLGAVTSAAATYFFTSKESSNKQ